MNSEENDMTYVEDDDRSIIAHNTYGYVFTVNFNLVDTFSKPDVELDCFYEIEVLDPDVFQRFKNRLKLHNIPTDERSLASLAYYDDPETSPINTNEDSITPRMAETFQKESERHNINYRKYLLYASMINGIKMRVHTNFSQNNMPIKYNSFIYLVHTGDTRLDRETLESVLKGKHETGELEEFLIESKVDI